MNNKRKMKKKCKKKCKINHSDFKMNDNNFFVEYKEHGKLNCWEEYLFEL
jgi:hypothetical protein